MNRLIPPDDAADGRALPTMTPHGCGTLSAPPHPGEVRLDPRRSWALLDAAADGVFAIDGEGRGTFLNPAGAAMLGYQPDEILHQDMHALLHHLRADGSPYPADACPISQVLWTGEPCRVEGEVFWQRDGGRLPVDFSASPLRESGTVTGAVVLFTDQTNRRQREWALWQLTALTQRQCEQYHDLLDSSSDGLAMGDLDRRLLFMNAAFARAFGIEPREAYFGKPVALIRRLILPTLRDPAAYVRCMDQAWADPEASGEVVIELRDGTVLRLRTAPIRTAAGRVFARAITFTDQTKDLELGRIRSEFVATVSHELRTPLTSLLGFSELLLHRQLPPVKQRSFIQLIHEESKRLTEMINDLLDIQRIESGRMTYDVRATDLASVVHAVEQMFSGHLSGHRLLIRLPADLPLLLVDRDRLQQVLENLLSNALKYSPGGGEVIVGARVLADERLLQVSVQDHGLGIPEDCLPRLFGKFYRVDSTDRRQIGGTGLGLALCREIIKAHGGQITVDTVLGRGSTFSFTLPLAPAVLPAPPHSESVRTALDMLSRNI